MLPETDRLGGGSRHTPDTQGALRPLLGPSEPAPHGRHEHRLPDFQTKHGRDEQPAPGKGRALRGRSQGFARCREEKCSSQHDSSRRNINTWKRTRGSASKSPRHGSGGNKAGERGSARGNPRMRTDTSNTHVPSTCYLPGPEGGTG